MTSQDVILGLLCRRSLTGYEIKNQMIKLISYFYDASYGTIYPTLSKMEKGGLITKESVVQEGRPNKYVYTITEQGKAVFNEYLHSEVQPNVFRSDFMVRLFYGDLADPEVAEKWVEQAREEMEGTLAMLRRDYERFAPRLSPTQEICIKLGLSSVETQLRVLEEGLQSMKAKRKE